MKKVKHRSNRAKDKGGGPDIWMHLHVALAQELILMYIMQTYVPDRVLHNKSSEWVDKSEGGTDVLNGLHISQ